MDRAKRFQTFSKFWPFYLQEHSKKGTRLLHFIGTSLFLLLLVPALVFSSWKLLLLSVLCAYGFAWIGHFFIEKNRPATFQYPLFSLLGDFKMYFFMWTGRLQPELTRSISYRP